MKNLLKDILSVFVPNKNSIKGSLEAGSLMLGITAAGILYNFFTLTPAAFAINFPWLVLGLPSVGLAILGAATLFFTPSILIRTVEVFKDKDEQAVKESVKEITPELKKELAIEAAKKDATISKTTVKSTNKDLQTIIDQDKTK